MDFDRLNWDLLVAIKVNWRRQKSYLLKLQFDSAISGSLTTSIIKIILQSGGSSQDDDYRAVY